MEPLRDLAVGEALGDQRQDPPLLLGERLEPFVLLVAFAEALEDPAARPEQSRETSDGGPGARTADPAGAAAGDGAEALDQLDRHPEIAVLFTDMVMPGGIGGAELARLARDRRPDLKVILTSGYAEPKSFEGVREDTDWLRKPHTAAELAQAMRKVLEG